MAYQRYVSRDICRICRHQIKLSFIPFAVSTLLIYILFPYQREVLISKGAYTRSYGVRRSCSSRKPEGARALKRQIWWHHSDLISQSDMRQGSAITSYKYNQRSLLRLSVLVLPPFTDSVYDICLYRMSHPFVLHKTLSPLRALVIMLMQIAHVGSVPTL